MNHNPEVLFYLPKTIFGMESRLTVLRAEIQTITDQLNSSEFYARFESDVAWHAWKNKAITARQWRRHELAWMLDHYHAALKDTTEQKQVRRSVEEDKRISAHERRRARLSAWAEDHQDQTFVKLMWELYNIAVDVEDDDEPPFDDYELDILRTVRAFLKEQGIMGTEI